MPLTVIAMPKAKNGHEEDLAALCRSLVAPTRDEAGCISYDLHRSHDDLGLFMFTESRETRPLREDLMVSPHLAAFGEKQDVVVDTWELFTGEKV